MPIDFSVLGIRHDLVQALQKEGVSSPTPIQELAIPDLMAGYDVIAQAQTGTGKTLAFVLPILERLEVDRTSVQALIVTPTRELALQITQVVADLAKVLGANVLAAYGGQDVERQIKKLRGAVHIVIGTPGRLLDHLRRGTVDFSELKTLVLDEADQMLHMGFLPEVEQILNQTSPERQTLLFSATMPATIRSLAKRYMRHPREIRVESPRVTLDEIDQVVIETSDRFKLEALCKMIDEYKPFLAIAFCRTKRRASTLLAQLAARGYEADELHGDLSQAKREKVMKRFREYKMQVLVATDVAARGLDVEGVTHVFNYDIPNDVESYIHRIGRTGRAGERGVAVTFVAPKDRDFLALIEKGIGRKITRRTANGQVQGAREETGGRLAGRSEKGGRGQAPGRGRADRRAGEAGAKGSTHAGERRGKKVASAGGGGARQGEMRGSDGQRTRTQAKTAAGNRSQRPGSGQNAGSRSARGGGASKQRSRGR